MTRSVLLVATLALAAGSVQADIWQRTIAGPDVAKSRHDAALLAGDELAQRANARGQSRAVVTSLVDQAIASYRNAAAAKPSSPEPYFRIATVIESFFTECLSLGRSPVPPTCSFNPDPARAKQAVDAWDEFEKRAPLDPRLADTLFSRAILRTKLVTTSTAPRPLLEGALRDYTSLLDRADGLTQIRVEQVWGNLAETYMMLGNIEEAIDAYQVALEKGGNSSTAYGKAVALDRDERTAEALDLIRKQGVRAFEEFQDEFAKGQVFYVPKGEEYYYFALINEAFGFNAEAIANWKRFISSGAHPQFHPRAKAHLDALAKKPVRRPLPGRDIFDGWP